MGPKQLAEMGNEQELEHKHAETDFGAAMCALTILRWGCGACAQGLLGLLCLCLQQQPCLQRAGNGWGARAHCTLRDLFSSVWQPAASAALRYLPAVFLAGT